MNKNILSFILWPIIVFIGTFIAYKIVHIPKQAEFVLIIAFLLFYPILRYPTVGLYIVFTISPLIPFFRRLYYLVYGRPGIDPLIMMPDLFIILIFIGIFFEFRERIRMDSNKDILLLITLYLAYLIIRTFVFNSLPLQEAIAKLKFYAPSVIMFYIGWLFANNHRLLKRILFLSIILGIISCLYGFNQLFLGYSTAEKLWFSSISFTTLFIKGIARPFSFFQSPAAFADYLIICIICLLIFTDIIKSPYKIVAFIIIPILFYGVLITSVRSSWVGAMFVFFVWFVFLRIKNVGGRIIMILFLICFFIVYQYFDDVITSGIGFKGVNSIIFSPSTQNTSYVDLLVTKRASALVNPFEEHSFVSRIALWKFIITSSVNIERALLGRGLGVLNADSLYFTYLAEFGYPGFLFIVFLTLMFILRGLKIINYSQNKFVVALVKGIITLNFSFAIMNITGSHLLSFPGDFYFWFLNGALISYYSKNENNNYAKIEEKKL
jgi:hypothetical protein